MRNKTDAQPVKQCRLERLGLLQLHCHLKRLSARLSAPRSAPLSPKTTVRATFPHDCSYACQLHCHTKRIVHVTFRPRDFFCTTVRTPVPRLSARRSASLSPETTFRTTVRTTVRTTSCLRKQPCAGLLVTILLRRTTSCTSI